MNILVIKANLKFGFTMNQVLQQSCRPPEISIEACMLKNGHASMSYPDLNWQSVQQSYAITVPDEGSP